MHSVLSFHLVLIIFAVVLAVHCNPNQKWLMGIVAFLFPEIYLLQFGIRKYLLKEAGYCPIPGP